MALDIIERGQKFTKYRDPSWAPGRYSALITLHDQHFWNAGWTTVQELLADDGLEGFSVKADQMRHIVRLMDDGSRRWHPRRDVLSEYLEFGRPQYWTGSQWLNMPLGTPIRSGNRLIWDRPGFAFTACVTWRKLLLSITLKNSGAARRFRFPISLNNLQWENWTLKSGPAVIATVNAEVAIDANGNEFPVIRTYQGGYVEYTADLTGAVFPVTLTPLNDTLTLGQGSNETLDTYLKASAATTNYGSADNWRVDLGDNHVGIMSWDLSSLAGATCTSATQTMYRYNNAGSSDLVWSLWQLAAANEDWTEAGATWNTKDGTNAWAGSVGCATATTDYISPAIGTLTIPGASGGGVLGTPSTGGALDTATVEAAFGGTLHLRVTGGSERNTCTAEHATAAYRPKLVVEYTTGGAAYVKNVSELLPLYEASLALNGLLRSVAEALGLYEAVSKFTGFARSVAELLSLGESTRASLSLRRFAAESVGLLGGVGRSLALSRSVAELANVYEAIGRRMAMVRFATVEKLTNGGFETAGAGGTDVFGSWTEDATDGAIASEGSLVHGGSAACKITAGASKNTEISQLFTVIPGLIYNVTFWTRGDGTNPGRYFFYDFTNTAYIIGITSTGVAGTTYQQVASSFTAPANCVQAGIYFRSADAVGGVAYIDDVSVPSTEMVGITESVVRRRAILAAIAELLGITEAPGYAKTLLRYIGEVVNIGEAVNKVGTLLRYVAETVNVTEVAYQAGAALIQFANETLQLIEARLTAMWPVGRLAIDIQRGYSKISVRGRQYAASITGRLYRIWHQR